MFFWITTWHSNLEIFLHRLPFSLSKFEDWMPGRTYTQDEGLKYLTYCRKKCHELVTGMTDEVAKDNWTNESKTMSYNVIEILLYTMRQVQHHAARLNLLLRQEINDAPDWIYEAEVYYLPAGKNSGKRDGHLAEQGFHESIPSCALSAWRYLANK